MKKINLFFIVILIFFGEKFSSKTNVNDFLWLERTMLSEKIKPQSIGNKNDIFSIFYQNDSETDKEIGKAIGAFSELEKSNNFTNRIDPNQLTEFPIGLRENFSNVEYGLVVTKAKFTSQYALINIYAQIIIPQTGADGGKRQLYFGAEEVKLSYEGRIIGDAKLSLLGNINIPFNQNQWMLTLEGGKINKNNGESINNDTFVAIDCDGIKELSLKGNIQISRNIIIPLDDDGKMLPEFGQNGTTNRVRGDFAVKATDWNDLLIKVSLSPFVIPSQVKNQDKGYFSFFVNNAVLDLSDLRTDSSVIFPDYYTTHGYLIAGDESWRGLFIKYLYIGLPEEFKTEKKLTKPISFEAQNLLIDSYGVSGSFSANDVFPLDEGMTNKDNAWRYSLDRISVDLVASKIVGASLNGKIQLPIQNQNEEQKNENSSPNYLAYQGFMTDDEYQISVATGKDINFDIWSAKATISEGSSIEMSVRNRTFYPKAILHGSLSISANKDDDNNSEGKKLTDFKGIKFQGLTLQTVAPFVTADYFGIQGEQRLAGFPASIKNIFVEADGGNANLGFQITVGLQEERFSASGGMKINGKIINENHRQRWKYDGFSLTKLILNNVDIGVATVSGELQIMNKDPLYGNGFMASLVAKDIKGLGNASVSVNAVFGCSTFKYWGFEGSIDGIRIPATMVDITGFTGGAFYRMIPDREMTLNPKLREKALVLKPDNTVGLAFRAGVYGALKDEKIASFMAGFSISTNSNGGLANIGFVGEAVVMSGISAITSSPFDKIQDKFKKMATNSKFIDKLKEDDNVNYFLDTEQATENYPLETDIPQPIYGKLAMNYDFNNRVFHASLDIFVNVAKGLITGVGQQGRSGSAVLHLAPDDWYLHIGTPTDMIGLRIGFGSFSLQSGSYFMVGNHIPSSPPPPSQVAEILGVELNDIDYMKDLNALGEGKGFAFGTHLNFDTGDMTTLFLYARFQAGLGTDIMLKNYGEAKCTNRGGDKIGINGWYANGQAYVYLQGELGIKIKLWFIKKKIPIIKASVASLLQAKGPNPYWVRGYLGGYYNLLGGMIKGKFRFKMEFGEECKLENESILGGMKIITDLNPKKDETDVDVFAIPQATFPVRVNEPIVIPEDDGDHTYKVIVEKMTIVDEQGNELKGTIEYANSKDIANFISEDILPPNKKLKAIAQVSFMEKKNGIYQVVMVDGQKATELEERSFTTGTAPNLIPLSNIQFAYPVVEQEHYYKGETSQGFIKLKRGQDYLFDDENWKTFTQFQNEKTTEISNFSYNNDENMATFKVPDLAKQQTYNFSIIAKNEKPMTAENPTEITTETTTSEDEDTEITTSNQVKKAQNISKNGTIERLAFYFKTSKYNTFSDKISSLKFKPLWIKISSDVVTLQNNMSADEYFDEIELIGSKYTDNQPLISLVALMNDDFANQFKGLFYDQYPIDEITLLRAENSEDFAGIPPVKAFPIFTSYLQYLANDKGNGLLRQTFPYKYDLFSYYKSDWYELVSKSASKYLGKPASARPSVINALLESSFGVIPRGKYKATAKYRLPNGKEGSQKEINYEFK